MTQQFSVQYSTMQISFIHIVLNIHIFFFRNKTLLNQPTAEKITVLLALTFAQTETLNHAPTTLHTQTSSYALW